jgi:hypothetical protein
VLIGMKNRGIRKDLSFLIYLLDSQDPRFWESNSKVTKKHVRKI